MKNGLVFPFICFMVLYLSGCSLISPKDYESVQGKHCYLSKVHFYRKGASPNTVFRLMNDMQIPKVMLLLEHKYGISVDYSEFDLFLYGKDPLKIRTEGLVSNNDFYWESVGKYSDRIEIDVLLTEVSAMHFDRDYAIAIKVENSTKVRLIGSFVGDAPVLTEIASRLNYSKKPASDDIYISKDTKEEIDLFAKFVQKKSSSEAEAEKNYVTKRGETRAKIKNSFDDLPVAERKRYIKDIRDYLDELDK